jgi:hypothetical protein
MPVPHSPAAIAADTPDANEAAADAAAAAAAAGQPAIDTVPLEAP